jgi:diacylglycerol kinase family enzyme
MGLDGEIVRMVERRQALKRAGGQGFFLWAALRVGLLRYDFRTPRMAIRWGPDLEHGRDGFTFAITQNLDPFTYLTRIPLRICPRAGLDLGIDCFAGRSVSRLRVLRWASQVMGGGGHIRDRKAIYLHDQPRILLSADRPMAAQMDGEFIGLRERLEIESVPGALAILA